MAEGSDPRARTSATSNESRANALGGVSWRKRKSPAVTRLLPGANGRARNSQNRGDRLRFRRWGVAMLPVIDSGRTRDRTTTLRSLLISTSALTAVALLAAGPGRAQTAPPPVQVAQNQGSLPQVQIEAPRKKPQARAKKLQDM